MKARTREAVALVSVITLLGLLIGLPPWADWIHRLTELAAYQMGYRR